MCRADFFDVCALPGEAWFWAVVNFGTSAEKHFWGWMSMLGAYVEKHGFERLSLATPAEKHGFGVMSVLPLQLRSTV